MSQHIAHRVIFERDDNGRWLVLCPEIPGAHSHGLTLASARSNIREAIALVLDIPHESSFDLTEEIRLDDPVLQGSVERAKDLRYQARGMEQQARIATLEAITTSAGSCVALSLRDLGDLLGLSHQRVQQIAASATQG